MKNDILLPLKSAKALLMASPTGFLIEVIEHIKE